MRKNYRIQAGCHSCKHCEADYDNELYFCLVDGLKRPEPPPQWETYPDLQPTKEELAEVSRLWTLVYRWEDTHTVAPFGICDKYERKEEEE